MKKTLYIGEYTNEEYRKCIKILMEKLGVEVEDTKCFDSDNEGKVEINVPDEETLRVLQNMSDCDYICIG